VHRPGVAYEVMQYISTHMQLKTRAAVTGQVGERDKAAACAAVLRIKGRGLVPGR
jgi:hypothetical protein